MKFKIQPRQSGKSYDIAQIMKKDKKAICIQPTESLKNYFCKAYNISKDRVFTAGDIIKRKIPRNKNVYIDEIGSLLNILIPSEIVYATTTSKIEVSFKRYIKGCGMLED
ncbi:hypothetical protein M0R04_11115 [Candidatus Dojkabacteria bacterium]|jgi:hypothetical protein|nr:hypothetical protein [Candidatus Dojkabacteria bacterium]